MTLNRRLFLRGLGVTLGLPVLESLGATGCKPPPRAPGDAGSFAIFFRQPSGVASLQHNEELGNEPERFWPRQHGRLTPESVAGRALEELTAHLERLLVVGNVNHAKFDYGDGHANGALQALTSQGPMPGTAMPFVEPNGPSLDMYLAHALTGGAQDSLYLHAGAITGYLGGACISHRAAGVRHAAERDPFQAFTAVMGNAAQAKADADDRAALRKSVNDVVRDQMGRLMAHPRLSVADRSRLQDHFDAIRDTERKVTCFRDAEQAARMEAAPSYVDGLSGDTLIQTVKLHLEVAVLAVACGHSRTVAIQVGDGNGGDLRFTDPRNGQLMENVHFVSHRRHSHDPGNGAIISDADVKHHEIDRQFARMFKHLVDGLAAHELPDGRPLLDVGVACWLNDNSNGRRHCSYDAPWIIAGSGNGFLKQGQFVDARSRPPGDFQCEREDSAPKTIRRLHNTIAAAVGVRGPDGEAIDDFGSPDLKGGFLTRLIA